MLILSGLALFTHIDNKNEPWKELGVSESEYWKVYKDIRDKSY